MVELENRTLDSLGRVELPYEFRQAQGWKPKSVVTIYQDNDTLVIKLADNQEKTYLKSSYGYPNPMGYVAPQPPPP